MSRKTPTKHNTETAKPVLVPKLRFSEFRGTEEWRNARLASLCERIMDGTHFSPKSTDGPRPYLTSKNVRDGYLDLSSVSGISEEEHRAIFSKCPVRKNDVLLTKDGANTGNCAINELEIEFSLLSSVAVLRANAEIMDPNFLFQSIWSVRTRKLIEDSMAGQAITRVTLEKIGAFRIPVGSVPEQRKIAECLSSLDELIAAQARKVDALKTHKKALMQQLFPREGETQPRLRFPEFQSFGSWGVCALGELSKIVRGGSPRPIDGFLTTAVDGLNWLKIGDVDKEAKYVTGTAEKVRKEALSKTRVVRPGDLILSNSMSFGRPYILKIETCIHDGWIAITDIRAKIDRDFLYYWISAPDSQAYFLDNAAGSGVQNLNADIIKGLSVRFPNLPEQHRIADFLSSLDALIAAEAERCGVLKTHKKGMMQQLFPSPEGVEA